MCACWYVRNRKKRKGFVGRWPSWPAVIVHRQSPTSRPNRRAPDYNEQVRDGHVEYIFELRCAYKKRNGLLLYRGGLLAGCDGQLSTTTGRQSQSRGQIRHEYTPNGEVCLGILIRTSTGCCNETALFVLSSTKLTPYFLVYCCLQSDIYNCRHPTKIGPCSENRKLASLLLLLAVQQYTTSFDQSAGVPKPRRSQSLDAACTYLMRGGVTCSGPIMTIIVWSSPGDGYRPHRRNNT